MGMETVCKSEGDGQKCPTCGGPVRQRVFGEMYAGAFVHDGERVEIRRVPAEGFADPIYLDELTQYFDGGLYRGWPGQRYLSRGGRILHRAVWESAFGPIPKGCHIHHKDHDALNNLIENLECLPKNEHLAKPRPDIQGKRLPDAALDKASEWHKSEAGRLWHSRMARRTKSWEKWTREKKPCEHCGKEYDALVRKSGHSQLYCSTTCKALAYRERKAAGGA